MRAFSSVPIFLLAALASAAPAAAGPYHNDLHHFSLEVPAGWRTMTNAELKAINDAFRGQLFDGNPIAFIAGFLPEKDKSAGLRQILLLDRQIAWNRGNTRENLERQYGQDVGMPVVKSGGDYAAVLRDSGGANLAADWKHNRLVYDKTVENVLAKKKVRNGMATQFCKAGIIGIVCCSPPDTFDADLPAFQVLNDSFAVDDGFDFKPESAVEKVKAVANRLLFILGIVVFLVVLIVVLVVVLMRGQNRRPRRRRPAEDDEEE